MKYFFDTEFIDNGKTIDLISIGIAAEDGRFYYAQAQESVHENACPWVKEHVLPLLEPFEYKARLEIASDIEAFTETDSNPEFIAYYGAYDWVCLCQLFGRMLDVPKNWPHFFIDLKLIQFLCDRKLPEQTSVKHHALNDAIWTKEAFEWIMGRI